MIKDLFCFWWGYRNVCLEEEADRHIAKHSDAQSWLTSEFPQNRKGCLSHQLNLKFLCVCEVGWGEWACGILNPESKVRITVLTLEQKCLRCELQWMLKSPMYACCFSVINIIIAIHRNPAPCILSTSSSSAAPSVYFSSSFSHTTMQIWQAQPIISSTTLDTESVTLKTLTPSWRREKLKSCQRWRPNMEFPKLREAGGRSGNSS